MLLNGSNKLLLGAFAALAMVTVGLKASAGRPDDGAGAPRSEVEAQLANSLRGQGFSTIVTYRQIQSSIVQATRGNCRLIARDARGGPELGPVFARDAKNIGPVRYLYRGNSSDTAPGVRFWLARLHNKVTRRLGLQNRFPVPIALATSPGCGGQNFGLIDFRA